MVDFFVWSRKVHCFYAKLFYIKIFMLWSRIFQWRNTYTYKPRRRRKIFSVEWKHNFLFLFQKTFFLMEELSFDYQRVYTFTWKVSCSSNKFALRKMNYFKTWKIMFSRQNAWWKANFGTWENLFRNIQTWIFLSMNWKTDFCKIIVWIIKICYF